MKSKKIVMTVEDAKEIFMNGGMSCEWCPYSDGAMGPELCLHPDARVDDPHDVEEHVCRSVVFEAGQLLIDEAEKETMDAAADALKMAKIVDDVMNGHNDDATAIIEKYSTPVVSDDAVQDEEGV